MSYDIRLVKIVTGEMVIGKWAEDGQTINDPAILQTVPSQQGVQMMMLPFGYPFETEISGEIETKHVLYKYANCPEELKDKYLEAVSNLSLSSGGLNNMMGGMGDMGGGLGGSGIIK